MSKKAFLRRIIPTIAFSGHRLPQFFIIDQLDKSDTCVVASLIQLDQCFFCQFDSMILYQLFHHLQYKIHI